MVNIENKSYRLSHVKYFPTLYATSGYYQIVLTIEIQKKLRSLGKENISVYENAFWVRKTHVFFQ